MYYEVLVTCPYNGFGVVWAEFVGSKKDAKAFFKSILKEISLDPADLDPNPSSIALVDESYWLNNLENYDE